MISLPFLAFLGIVSAFTIFFSMFNEPRIRGFRNLGFLTIYLGTVAGFFMVGWKATLVGWAIFGVASGVIYYAYELYETATSKEEQKEWPRPSTLIHGLYAWPVMLPEATEYFLAALGVLKAPESPAAEQDSSQDPDDR
jgi:hypothetical protein